GAHEWGCEARLRRSERARAEPAAGSRKARPARTRRPEQLKAPKAAPAEAPQARQLKAPQAPSVPAALYRRELAVLCDPGSCRRERRAPPDSLRSRAWPMPRRIPAADSSGGREARRAARTRRDWAAGPRRGDGVPDARRSRRIPARRRAGFPASPRGDG